MSSLPAYIRIAEQIKTEWLLDSQTRKGARLPTQEVLANQLGVSRSTIVRALSKLVAEGYIHSQQGSGAYVSQTPPRDGKLRFLSLIVPNLHAPVIVQVCRGVEQRARQKGFEVLIASSGGSTKVEQSLIERHVNTGALGVVLYPNVRTRAELATDYLINNQIPVPVIATDIGYDYWPCSRVQFDNLQLGYDMTRQLIRHGHKRIAFQHALPNYLHPSIVERSKGWLTAMEEAGLPIPPQYLTWPDIGDNMNFTDPDDDIIADSLIELNPRPDAVIGWDDPAVARLIQALINRGIRVPNEMRIVGFDYHPLVTRLFRPIFPTSRPDFVRLGEIAVDTLVETLSGKRNYPCVYYYPVPVQWREPRGVQSQTGEEAHQGT